MKLSFSGQIPGRTIIIDVAQLQSGELIQPSDAAMQVRPIEALGVDARRFQEIGRRASPLVFTTYRATNDIERMEKASAGAVAKLVNLRVVSPTRPAPYVFDDVLVLSVSTVRRTGPMSGVGSVTGTRFTLVQQWIFEL